jgi:signal transduction histidine kinase
MSPEDLNTLFKPFYRTSDKASLDINKDSHGLGLSICKLLAERMNGSLSVSSTIGMGSTFTFMFTNDINDVELLKKK